MALLHRRERLRHLLGPAACATWPAARSSASARSRFTGNRNSYELGDPVTLELKVLDPILLTQLPPELRVEVVDEATGQTIRQETMQKQEASPDTFSGDVHRRPGREVPDQAPGPAAALAEAMRETQAGRGRR